MFDIAANEAKFLGLCTADSVIKMKKCCFLYSLFVTVANVIICLHLFTYLSISN